MALQVPKQEQPEATQDLPGPGADTLRAPRPPRAGDAQLKSDRLAELSRFANSVVGERQPKTIQEQNLEEARSLFEDIAREDVVRLNMNLERGRKLKPGFGRRVARMAGKLGVTLDFIAPNIETLEALERNGDLMERLADLTEVRDFIRQDERFAQMTAEDLKSLDVFRLLKTPRWKWKTPEESLRRQAEQDIDDRIAAFESDLTLRRPTFMDAQIGLAGAGFVGEVETPKEARQRFERTVEGVKADRSSLVAIRFKQLQDQEALITGEGEISFIEEFERRKRENPLFLGPFAAGIVDFANDLDIKDAAIAMANDTATPRQRRNLIQFGRIARAMKERGHDSFGVASQVFFGIPSLAGEIVFTGGAFSAAKGGILKGAQITGKSFLKAAVNKALTSKVVQNRISATALAAAVQLPFASTQRILGEITQRTTPAGTAVELEDGNLGYQVFPETADPFLAAIPKAVVSQWIELFTERIGEDIERIALTPAKKKLLNTWAQIRGKAGVPLSTTAAYNQISGIYNAAGIHGVIAELGEEQLAALLQGMTGVGPSYNLPLTKGGTTAKELAGQTLAFGVLPFARGAIGSFGKRITPSGTNMVMLEAIEEALRDSVNFTESPDVMEPVASRTLVDTERKFTYVPTEAVISFAQENLDPQGRRMEARRVAEELGVPEKEWTEAVDAGRPIQVKTERYNAVIGKSEHAAKFRREIRNDPDEMNERELNEFLESQEDEVEEETRQFDDSLTQVTSAVRSQLEQAGEPAGKVDAQVKLWESIFRALATRARMDPLELFQQYGLQIVRPELAELRSDFITLEQAVIPEEEARRPLAQRFAAPEQVTEKGILEDVFADNLPRTRDQIRSDSLQPGASPQVVQKLDAEIRRLTREGTLERIRPGVFVPKRTIDEQVTAGKSRQEVLRDLAAVSRRETGRGARIQVLQGDIPGSPIGFTSFGPDRSQFIIALLKSANLTTFLHESGHFFLEVLADLSRREGADPSLARDYAKILGWFGTQSRSNMYRQFRDFVQRQQDRAKADTSNIAAQEAARIASEALALAQQNGGAKFMRRVALTGGSAIEDFQLRAALMTPFHELWAKTFEVYLATGQAPTTELQGVFAKFKAWFVWAYGELRKMTQTLGVTLPEEIREVMDRLVATNEELQIAEEEQSAEGLFINLQRSGMDEETAREYVAARQSWRAAGQEESARRIMAQFKRERSQQLTEELNRIKKEIAKGLNKDKVHQAISVLSRGKMPDGTPLPEGMPTTKLSTDELVAQFGRDILTFIPKSLYAKNGVAIDEAAEVFGFESGDRMIQAFLKQFQQVRTRSGLLEKDAELREELKVLQVRQKELEAVRQELKAETAEAKKALRKRTELNEKRVARILVVQENASTQGLREIALDIKARGGVRPVVTTKELPKEFKVTRGGGVASDELAQELADRGVLKDADTQTLLDWLNATSKTLKESKQRILQIPKNARKIAQTQTSEAIDTLIRNVTEQIEAESELVEVRKKRASFERELANISIEDTIETLAKEEMRRRHGDILNDPTLAEQAMRIVHNEKQAEVRRLEFKHLLSSDLPKFRGINRLINRKTPNLPEFRRKAERDMATKQLFRIQPRMWKNREAFWAREARKRLDSNDLEGAFDAKHLEALNGAYYTAAADHLERAETMERFIRSLDKKALRSRIGKGDPKALDQVDLLRDQYSMTRLSTQGLEARSLREFIDGLESEGRHHAIPKSVVDRTRRMNFRELTFEEFEGLHDALQSLVHVALEKDTVFRGTEKRRLSEDKLKLIESLLENATNLSESNPTFYQRIKGALSKFRGLKGIFLLPDTIVEELDGFRPLGTAYQTLKGPIDEGMLRFLSRVKKLSEDHAEIFRQSYTMTELRRLSKERVFIPEAGISLTRENIIMIASYWGTQSSREAVLNSRNLFGLGRGTPTEQQILAVLDKMSEKDWQFVQAMWAFNETFFEEMNAAHQRRTGLPLTRVERVPVETKFGTIPGGFMTHKFDAEKSARAEEISDDEFTRLINGYYGRASVQGGFMKERVGTAGQAVRLDLAVWLKHGRDVLLNLELADAVNYMARILADKDVKNAFIDSGNKVSLNAIDAWLRDAATQEVVATDAISIAARWLRVGQSISAMGWNVRTGIIQLTGFLQAFPEIEQKYFIAALKDFHPDNLRGENGILKQMHEIFPLLRVRSRTFSKEFTDANAILEKWNFLPKSVRTSFFYHITMAQLLVDHVVVQAAYRKGLDRFLNDHDRAVTFAERMLVKTQASGIWTDRSAIERGTISRAFRQSEVIKSFTTFASYQIAKFSLAYKKVKTTDLGTLTQPNVLNIAKFASDMMMLYLWEGLLVSVVYGGFPDEDDDESVAWFALKTASRNMIEGIPFIREIPSETEGFRGGGAWGAFLGTFGRAFNQVEQGEFDRTLVKSVNTLGGFLLKYPSTQMNRVMDATWREVEGDDVTFMEYLVGRPRRR